MTSTATSFWQRIDDLRASINGNTTPLDSITLRTQTVKIHLGLQLLQSIILAATLSLMYHSFAAWIIPMSTLLQIGWIWNRVTDYWKRTNGDYSRVPTQPQSTSRASTATQPKPELFETALDVDLLIDPLGGLQPPMDPLRAPHGRSID